MGTVLQLKELNKLEACRYMGYNTDNPDEKLLAILERCEKNVLETAKPRFVYRVFDISINVDEQFVAVGNTKLKLTGKSICDHLSGCGKAVLMAATVSSDIDRLIRISQLTDMTEALATDSLASVAIEQTCDMAEQIIKAENPGFYMTFRFGLGYGDLPINLQPEFVKVLNASKLIGLNVTESCMLTPTKSVTAVIGLSETKIKQSSKGCATCNMYEKCGFRKKGGHCNG